MHKKLHKNNYYYFTYQYNYFIMCTMNLLALGKIQLQLVNCCTLMVTETCKHSQTKNSETTARLASGPGYGYGGRDVFFLISAAWCRG